MDLPEEPLPDPDTPRPTAWVNAMSACSLKHRVRVDDECPQGLQMFLHGRKELGQGHHCRESHFEKNHLVKAALPPGGAVPSDLHGGQRFDGRSLTMLESRFKHGALGQPAFLPIPERIGSCETQLSL